MPTETNKEQGNREFLESCLIRALHEGYMPAEKLIELALGMDARNLTDEKCEQLVQTLERAIDAHHAASYRRKAVVA
jgi:hypothetical protein